MKKLAAITAALLCICAIAWAFAGERNQNAEAPHNVLIVPEMLHEENGVGKGTAISISDAEKIQRLEKFFPNYRKSPSSSIAGGWKAGYRVYFSFGNGRTIRLTVSNNDNGGTWSVDDGDLSTQGNFAAFVNELEQSQPPRRFMFHDGAVENSKLKVALTTDGTVVKDQRGLVLPVTIKNESSEIIKTTLAHEWHGGEWPPTSLFASVTRIPELGTGIGKENEPQAEPFAPVYLAGEDPDKPREVTLKPGEDLTVQLRMDWPGTGSVKGKRLIEKPGKYVARLALLFKVDSRQQYVQSDDILIEYEAK